MIRRFLPPPYRLSSSGLHVLIGGQTATSDDFAGVLSSKLPMFIGVVVLLSFLLLTAVLRSLLIQGNAAFTMNTGSVEEIIRMDAMNTLLRYSVIVVATVPMLVIYPFAQRYFVKGVMLGSLKE